MIIANKEKVERDYRVRMMSIREAELNYYVVNAQQVATLSALLLGLSCDSLIDTTMEQYDLTDNRTYGFAELAQPIAIVITMGVCTFCCWGSMLVAVLAPRLALYGPPSTYSYLVDAVEEEFEYLMYGFVASAISFCSCTLLWCWASLPFAVASAVTVLGAVATFSVRMVYVYTYKRFEIPAGAKVTGRWYTGRLGGGPGGLSAAAAAAAAVSSTPPSGSSAASLWRSATVAARGYTQLEDVMEQKVSADGVPTRNADACAHGRATLQSVAASAVARRSLQRAIAARRESKSASLLRAHAQQAFAAESLASGAGQRGTSVAAEAARRARPLQPKTLNKKRAKHIMGEDGRSLVAHRTATGGWACEFQLDEADAACSSMPGASASPQNTQRPHGDGAASRAHTDAELNRSPCRVSGAASPSLARRSGSGSGASAADSEGESEAESPPSQLSACSHAHMCTPDPSCASRAQAEGPLTENSVRIGGSSAGDSVRGSACGSSGCSGNGDCGSGGCGGAPPSDDFVFTPPASRASLLDAPTSLRAPKPQAAPAYAMQHTVAVRTATGGWAMVMVADPERTGSA